MKSEIFDITITGKYYSLQLPEAIVRPFLEKDQRRVKVVASYEGKEVHFHAAIQKRKGAYFMIFGKRHQKELGIFPNDYFQLQLFKDTTKYGVEIPEELQAVFDMDPEAVAIFDQLPDGTSRGLIYAIARYKASQTRIDKALLLCENLKRGLRDRQMLLKSF